MPDRSHEGMGMGMALAYNISVHTSVGIFCNKIHANYMQTSPLISTKDKQGDVSALYVSS